MATISGGGFDEVLQRTNPNANVTLHADVDPDGRPLLTEYLRLYTPRQATRHRVTPGITGWARIHGRNALSWERELELDADCVECWSLWLDVRILARTALIVLRRRGVSTPGHATTPSFTGSPPGTP